MKAYFVILEEKARIKYMLPEKKYIKYKDMNKVKEIGWKKTYHANSNKSLSGYINIRHVCLRKMTLIGIKYIIP